MIIKIFSNLAPHYRSKLWSLLLSDHYNEIHFFYGHNEKLGIKYIDFNNIAFYYHKEKLHKVDNVWIKGHILIWQKGIISHCIKNSFDHAIFLGEMYCISTWIAALVCRLKGIKTTFWGHGIYGNEGKFKLFIRKMFYSLSHNHLLYERRAKQLMIQEGFNSNYLHVIFNSLEYDIHKEICTNFHKINKYSELVFFKNPELPTLVFIGRLTKTKKLEMLVKAVISLNERNISFNLLIIGDGPEIFYLKELSSNGISQGWIHYTGSIYDEELIGKYLYLSDLCISPGNIGLTAIHSLSFGTPLGTHSNLMNQMPEVETITDGFNGFLFEENNLTDLIQKIKNWFIINHNREIIRTRCFEIIDKYYNPYFQIEVFKRLFNNFPPLV